MEYVLWNRSLTKTISVTNVHSRYRCFPFFPLLRGYKEIISHLRKELHLHDFNVLNMEDFSDVRPCFIGIRIVIENYNQEKTLERELLLLPSMRAIVKILH